MAQLAEKIPLVPIASSNLAAVGYNEAKRILAIEFKSGAIYHYAGVPEEVAGEFAVAESRGKFYAAHIKGKYQGQKMTGPCPNCGDSGWIGETCQDCGTAEYIDTFKEQTHEDRSSTEEPQA